MTIMAPSTARKEIFALVDSVWTDKAPAIVGAASAPVIRWQGDEEGALPGGTEFWMRASTQGVDTEQSGFAVGEHTQSGVRFTTTGIVILQLFAPMKGDGYAKGELLAALGQCMFMASHTPSGVWFRRPRINELENDGTWYRWNVIADYQFDQAKGT